MITFATVELIYISSVQDVIDQLTGQETLPFIQPEEVIFEEKNVVEVKKRVMAARDRQYNRYGREICNSSVPFEQLISHNLLTNQQQHYLQTLSIKQGLSNLVQIKIIRLARTIADLEGEDSLFDDNLNEAITLRKMKRDTMSDMSLVIEMPRHARVKKIEGLSKRQAARILGVSPNLVFKA